MEPKRKSKKFLNYEGFRIKKDTELVEKEKTTDIKKRKKEFSVKLTEKQQAEGVIFFCKRHGKYDNSKQHEAWMASDS